jgi:hypothetical protein
MPNLVYIVHTYILQLRVKLPITATRSKALTVFAHLNAGIVGLNPTQDMDVCARLFCVCVVCVGSSLAAG